LILKGVTVGKYSIVAAGSIVTKSIPPNEIWGGNPAKFIRRILPTTDISSDNVRKK
jgi:acetyltransferase-like isoleucine patch superfamily enzyme